MDQPAQPRLSHDPSYPVHARGLARQLVPGFSLRGGPPVDDGVASAYLGRLPRDFDWNFFLLWPPNLFCFTSLFFRITGSHSLFADHGAAQRPNRPPHPANVADLGLEWFKKLTELSNGRLDEYRSMLCTLLPKTNLIPPGQTPEEEAFARERDRYTEAFLNKPEVLGNVWPKGSCRYLDMADLRERLHTLLHARGPEAYNPFGTSDGKGWHDPKAHDEELVPVEVVGAWSRVVREMAPARESCARQIWTDSNIHLLDDFILLHAVSDYVCEGWGVRQSLPTREGTRESWLFAFASALLNATGNLSLISSDRARVLPKRHTPEVGVSLRAVSSSLAFAQTSVQIQWLTGVSSMLEDSEVHRSDGLSILLLPWPMRVRAQDFAASRRLNSDRCALGPNDPSYDAKVGYFKYSPTDGGADRDLGERLSGVLHAAEAEVGKGQVDMVILPEAAICATRLGLLEEVLRPHVRSYIAGVRKPGGLYGPGADGHRDRNEVHLGIIDRKTASTEFLRLHHHKHHRWRLDRRQIQGYKLGGQLFAGISHWEDIDVEERVASFVNIGEELTVCPVICEDLARQDELSNLIRSVGPSLLVAILMDGPQMKDRWSAKYAGIFGDDPGCAALTLTSKGMLRRTRRHGEPLGPVALWTERGGVATEIPIDEDSDAVLLNLAVESDRQTTLDGRKGCVGTYSLSLAGVHQIRGQEPD